MMKPAAALIAVLLLSACGKASQQRSAAPVEKSANNESGLSTTEPPVPPPATGPDARTPLAAADHAVDPNSREAAENLVNAFVKLLNRRRFAEAYMLLGPGAPPRKEFEDQFKRYSDLHVSAGKAGEPQGAAGSIFIEVPVTISGTLSGKRVARSASAVLRRVNDVPGSSEEQRRWHIERIDWS